MARYVARFLKNVLGDNGCEAEICQRSLEVEAANQAHAAEAAKVKFCDTENVTAIDRSHRDWTRPTPRPQG